MPQYADATLTIDLGAIAANYTLLRERASGAECTAVVKADAYGLGMAQVAPALAKAGCTTFFVAHLDEGIELRKILPEVTIAVFHGLFAEQEAVFAAHNLIPVLNDLGQVQRAKEAALPSILHVDTGMNRLGLNLEEVGDAEGLDLCYIMTHLACANQPEYPLNAVQLERFNQVREKFPDVPATMANSSGIFLGEEYHCDLVRPGSALYGVSPSEAHQGVMQQVATLKAKIIQTRTLSEAQAVGYGATKEMPASSRLATIPVGYADGYLRSLSNAGFGMIDGAEVSIVGRVSMDLIVLDVTQLPEEKAQVGEEVELIGRQLPVDTVAKRAETIGYEVLTRLGARFKRDYI